MKKSTKTLIFIIILIVIVMNGKKEGKKMAGYTTEDFTTLNNIAKLHNIDISEGNAKISRTDTYTPFNVPTQEASTIFLLTFDNGLDAAYSIGNGTQKSSNLPSIITDDYGNAASFNNGGILWFTAINNMPTTNDWTVEFMLKTDGSQFKDGTILHIHNFLVVYLKPNGVTILPPDAPGGRFMGSLEGINWDNRWHQITVTSTTEHGLQEMFLFVDGQLTNYKNAEIGLLSYKNTDYGYGMTIGGKTYPQASSNFTLLFDNFRISNIAKFPNTVNSYEPYTIYKSYLESKVIDTGMVNPSLNLNWDETSSETTRVSIHFMFSDDGVNFERFIPHPTISLSQDGAGDSAYNLVYPEFNSRGYTGSLTFTSPSSFSWLGELYNKGWDLGIETDPKNVNNVQSLHDYLMDNGWSHYVFRPYFNIRSRQTILNLAPYFKFSHNGGNDVNYLDDGLMAANKQVDQDYNAYVAQVNDAVSRNGWKIITYHALTNSSLPKMWIDYAESQGVEIMNVWETLNTYMAQNNSGSTISHHYTKRYFKYYVFLYSNDGQSTPTIDNLNIIWGEPTYDFVYFNNQKSNYLNGGLFSDFINNANNWVS